MYHFQSQSSAENFVGGTNGFVLADFATAVKVRHSMQHTMHIACILEAHNDSVKVISSFKFETGANMADINYLCGSLP